MSLNCEAGKLAIVLKTEVNAGRIVTPLRLLTSDDVLVSRCGNYTFQWDALTIAFNGPLWILDGWTSQSWLIDRDGKPTGTCEVQLGYDPFMRKLDGDVNEDDMELFEPTPLEHLVANTV